MVAGVQVKLLQGKQFEEVATLPSLLPPVVVALLSSIKKEGIPTVPPLFEVSYRYAKNRSE